MKRKNSVRMGLLAVLVGMLAAGYALAQEKDEALAEKLATFIPQPVAGLADHLPWESEGRGTKTNTACGETGCDGDYASISAFRPWKFDDPALAKQVDAAQKEYDALWERFKQGAEAYTAMEKATEHLKDLTDSVRNLEFTLAGNVTPESCSGEIPAPVRSGTLKGRPLYRTAATLKDYGALSQHVCLAVLVGPESFKNPPQKKAGEQRAELKTIFVKARIESTPQSVKADEALARQLLEKVDYDGLAKLLTP